jgi:NifU-like protein
MWDYTDKVKDHFRNPRNVGVIADADGTGEVGSLACGDALKLTIKVGKDGRIADAKFQTFGCASAIASASALTELVKGKTLEEAATITNQDIARHLGGLPKEKMHCSVMGREALEAAIENYRTGARTVRAHEERVVCTCFGVTEEVIERAIRENGLSTVEEVTNYTKAGGGCGGCREDIEAILERMTGKPPPVSKPEPPPARKLTTIQKIRLIQETIDREVRPLLKRDGGDLELVDVNGNQVVVAFRGTCHLCRVAGVTLKDVVQPKLREFVSPDLVVVEETP